MDDLIPHPVASILFGLAVVALFLWQGFEENPRAKRSAQHLSRPAILTERPQEVRLPQQIHSVSRRDTSEQAEAEIKPKPTTKIYYRITVPDSGTLEAGDVVIKLTGIDPQRRRSMPGRQGQELALRQRSEGGAEAADSRPRRRLRPARAQRAEVIHGACTVAGTISRAGWCAKDGPSQTTHRSLLLLMRPKQRSPSVSVFGVEP